MAQKNAADLEDFKQTILARLALRPTGDIEETLRPSAKPGTLLLNGQTVNRADYPALWQWVQDQSLVGSGKPFGTGDGSTTFVLPNYAGKIARGVASGETVGQLTGADSLTLSAAHLPSHKHNVGVTMTSGHAHAIFGSANHGGHGNGGVVLVPEGSFYGVVTGPVQSLGAHDHGESVEGQNKPYIVAETAVGSGSPIDLRQSAFAVNWLIYT
ncbi:tail fiber protein [Pseudonocardia dioxanivorans]|uniref:tail fiber protein n=1 Tax=Pseudonocardia dioxanivorans TaxID=240495 RepID=UPI001180FB1C|nr:phage tail protein [Pseudonocardia dioxanivorans]